MRSSQISFSIIWILDIFVSKIKEEIVRPLFIPTRYLCLHGLTMAYRIFRKELDYKLHYESLSPATALVTKAVAAERLSSSNPTNDVCNFIQYSRDNYKLDRVLNL